MRRLARFAALWRPLRRPGREEVRIAHFDTGWWSVHLQVSAGASLDLVVTVGRKKEERRYGLLVIPGRVTKRLVWLPPDSQSLVLQGPAAEHLVGCELRPATARFARQFMLRKLERYAGLGVVPEGLVARMAALPRPGTPETAAAWLACYDCCFPPPMDGGDAYAVWRKQVEPELHRQVRTTRTVRFAFLGSGGDEAALGAGRRIASVDEAEQDEWIVPLGPADRLADHALDDLAAAIEAHPRIAVWYTDEDRITARGERVQPQFKAAFDPDRLLAGIALGRLWAVQAGQLAGMNGRWTADDPARELEVQLWLWGRLGSQAFGHIPTVCCHRLLSGERSARSQLLSRQLAVVRAYAAGAEPAAMVAQGRHGTVRWTWPLPDDPPAVSLVVPTRDGVMLERCMASLLATRWPKLEVVLVDNGSRKAETQVLLRRLEADPRVRILRDPRPFNWAALNNAAVAAAKGEFVALVNDDIEAEDPGWLAELMRQALRPGTGCVGPLLLYPDRTVQHAGVGLGLGGVAGHPLRGLAADDPGYDRRLAYAHSLAAVTGACLVVRKDTYLQVGGCEEGLAVAFNDVDLCLKVRALGLANRWTPHAVLIHHESVSRGKDDTSVKRERFEQEFRWMRKRWGPVLDADPCWNPNLAWHVEVAQPATIQRWYDATGLLRPRLGDGWSGVQALRRQG